MWMNCQCCTSLPPQIILQILHLPKSHSQGAGGPLQSGQHPVAGPELRLSNSSWGDSTCHSEKIWLDSEHQKPARAKLTDNISWSASQYSHQYHSSTTEDTSNQSRQKGTCSSVTLASQCMSILETMANCISMIPWVCCKVLEWFYITVEEAASQSDYKFLSPDAQEPLVVDMAGFSNMVLHVGPIALDHCYHWCQCNRMWGPFCDHTRMQGR